ncbi:MAG: AAA family ATPase, partial [Methylococcales bacterium]|nr:AAA family ATPase [Methylococcales bacterium]
MKEVAQISAIKKIDIKNFGLFSNFFWNSVLGGDTDANFKRVNIIYGRNYSGKTTLSRIFRCVENGQVHEKYPNSDFSISLDSENLTQDNLGTVPNDVKVRVYNTDFVKANLSWLHRDDGNIESFALLGAVNLELERKIKEIEEKLGENGDKNGLFFELEQKTIAYGHAHSIVDTREAALNKQLTDEARDIKNNTKLYDNISYNINGIRRDIPQATESCILSEDVINEKKSLLKDEAKENIQALSESKPKFLVFQAATNTLLTREIKPNQSITDLINDNLLQNWVLEGIDRHKDKRDSCGFCGKPLPDDLWNKLDAHFSEESKTLRRDIVAQITALETAKQHIHNYKKIPAKENFYASFHFEYDRLLNLWQEMKVSYSENLDCLIERLRVREKDIFTTQIDVECNDVSEDIFSLFGDFDQII